MVKSWSCALNQCININQELLVITVLLKVRWGNTRGHMSSHNYFLSHSGHRVIRVGTGTRLQNTLEFFFCPLHLFVS